MLAILLILAVFQLIFNVYHYFCFMYFAPRRGPGGVGGAEPPRENREQKIKKSENQIFCSGCLAGQETLFL